MAKKYDIILCLVDVINNAWWEASIITLPDSLPSEKVGYMLASISYVSWFLCQIIRVMLLCSYAIIKNEEAIGRLWITSYIEVTVLWLVSLCNKGPLIEVIDIAIT